ncbi:MAG TPA: SpoIIE family protein phosphatase, partial [Candidatus Ozemobacteraceae bacterium]|nr:SpoIIE family protein phosphatase [Candidatus Ozemobacteraceae bacterium]
RLDAGLIGSETTTALSGTHVRERMSRLETTVGRVWLFDGAGRMAYGTASEPAVIERVFRTLRRPWYERTDIHHDTYPGSVDQLGGFNWIDLIDRNRRFSPVNGRVTSGWGYWAWRDNLASDTIGGLLVLLDRRALEGEAVLDWVTEDLRRSGIEVGWLHRLNPGRSRLPRGVSLAAAKEFERAHHAQGLDAVRLGDADAVLRGYRDQSLLIRIVPASSPRLPAVSWLLLLVWLTPVIRWVLFGSASPAAGSGTTAPRLATLLLLAVSAAGILPLGLSLLLWREVAGRRTLAVTTALCQELEQRLVRIDRKFPALIERLAARYRDWRGRLEAQLARDPAFPDLLQTSSHGLEVRRFPAESPKARLIDETLEWEERGTLDTVFVVDRNGRFWRPHNDSMMLFRRMARWPRDRMMRTLASLYERQTNRSWQEFEWLLRMPPEGYPRERFFGDSLFGRGVTSRLSSQLSRAAINKYNIWKNISDDVSGREDVAALAVTDMAVSAGGEDVVATMLRRLGTFTINSNEAGAAAMFVDVIRGATGAAIGCLTVFHHSGGLAALFFDELYATWPERADGMRLYAISEFPCTLLYPGLHDDRKFSRLFRRLEPPHVMLSQAAVVDGKPVILAALNCRQIWNYSLVGTLPWTHVEERVGAFRNRLLGGACAMSLILGLLCLRVWRGVARPVAALVDGVEAMEHRRLEHRIAISTGDELERLAETFNATLAGMEELEVARVVQQKLLPAGEVTSGRWRYRGVSVMCSEVGGDYHDARLCPDGSIAFFLGDVSGHGVSAALVVAMAKAAFGNLVRSGCAEPGELLGRLNEVIIGTVRKRKMMTAVAGLAKPDGTLLLANAGHCYPALLRSDGSVELRPWQGSLPLGVRLRGSWTTLGLEFGPGDRLLLYTDGIPEAVDRDGVQLGYSRWEEFLRAEAAEPDAAQLISRLHDRIRRFTQPVGWTDDVTITVLSYN